MASPRVERRLAAILVADVVGYSRLMERDEGGTLERLKAHRKEFVGPLIAEHRGRIVKLMGDGALCEFGSIVDAVGCAILIQQGVAEREEGLPEDGIRRLCRHGPPPPRTRSAYEVSRSTVVRGTAYRGGGFAALAKVAPEVAAAMAVD